MVTNDFILRQRYLNFSASDAEENEFIEQTMSLYDVFIGQHKCLNIFSP